MERWVESRFQGYINRCASAASSSIIKLSVDFLFVDAGDPEAGGDEHNEFAAPFCGFSRILWLRCEIIHWLPSGDQNLERITKASRLAYCVVGT